jgi:hypothetical protein
VTQRPPLCDWFCAATIQFGFEQSASRQLARILGRPGLMIAPIETGRHNQVLILFFVLNTDSAMPQRPEERLVPDSDVPNPVTPTKPFRNAVGCQDKFDAEISVLSEENDAELESLIASEKEDAKI